MTTIRPSYSDLMSEALGRFAGTDHGEIVAIQVADVVVALSQEVLRDAVDRARDKGWSWHIIGEALGLTAEGARQRFREVAKP